MVKAFKLLLAGLLLSSNAWSVIPENGWWWASSESGRGFNIEIQNNTLFMASFTYDAAGNAVWAISSGTMTSDRDYAGRLLQFRGGQCFGCDYRPPIATDIGTMTLFFTSSQTAVLTVNGLSINVKRFDFWLNEVTPDAMLGEWSSVIGAAGFIFDGERIQYKAKGSSATGAYAAGNRLGYSGPANVAVVQYFPAQGYWEALLDSSTSYWRLFRFNTTGFNRMEGTFWIYPKGSSPSGNGEFFQAFRTASAARVLTGSGPGSSKDSSGEEEIRARSESRDEAHFKAMSAKGPGALPADSSLIESSQAMERLLIEHRRSLRSAD